MLLGERSWQKAAAKWEFKDIFLFQSHLVYLCLFYVPVGITTQQFVPQLYNIEDGKESRNWMESVEGGIIDRPDLLGDHYSTQKEKSYALVEASAVPNPDAKTYVVLSIHQKFLRLQASRCFLWYPLV